MHPDSACKTAQEEWKGIVRMLSVIQSDFERTIQETHAAEEGSEKRSFSLRGITRQHPRVLDFVNRFMANNPALLVAFKTIGSEFPKPANHEIPVVVLVVLPNGGLLEFMNFELCNRLIRSWASCLWC